MFKYIGDQAERLGGGLIGATLGVIFAMSTRSIGAALAFLLSFFVLFCVQSLPKYFTQKRNRESVLHAFLTFIGFLVLWVLATIYFGNILIFQKGWVQEDMDVRVITALGTLFIIAIVSVVSAILEGLTPGNDQVGANE